LVKAKRKTTDEIKNLIKGYNKIINIGCGGCVSVCLAGGQKEVSVLNEELKMSFKDDNARIIIDAYTVERQCNMTFLEELDEIVPSYDCILSMACGAGVQLLAEKFHGVPVFPSVNTVNIGIDRDLGVYEEKCRACGECVLGYTGGICPVTRCAKGLFNGPCGGTNKGKCEIDDSIPCAWDAIYTRLKEQNRLKDILEIQPPMLWQNQIPRTVIQESIIKKYL
jgi:ferredoxin